jgi:two-component system phosphate regulon sensor histidine kinase PhoR
MYRGSLTSRLRRVSRRQHVIIVAILLAIVFALSVASAELRLPGFATAPWWPAAGAAALAALTSRGRGILIPALVFVVTALANAVVGTPWPMALGFGVANAAEAWVVAAIMRFRRESGRSFRAADSVRFLVAAGAGGAVIGTLAGLVVALGGGSFLDTASHVTASHASAVLLIAGFGVLPRSSFRFGRPWELAAQVVILAAAIAVAFAINDHLPLAFLPFPALAWAAFRFGSGIVLAEIGLTSLAVLVLSLLGGGSFAHAAGPDGAMLIGLVQLYALSLIVSMLPLAALQDDQQRLFLRLKAREQLLRGVVVGAHAGFVVVRHEEGRYDIVESNPNGLLLLAPWVREADGQPTLVRAEIDPIAAALADGDWTGERDFDGTHVQLFVTTVAGDRDMLLVQAVDTTKQTAAARALADALDHEREALERLRDLAAQKDEFVSSVSHELRTPVTSILGYAEELADGVLPETERHSVDVIMRNARRLAELVEDLLSLSRMAGEPSYTPVRVDLSQALSESAEELAPLAERGGIRLSVPATAGLGVIGDPLWVDRVLANLLTNAIKFTPPGGTVTVTVDEAPGGATELRVSDSGRGIPADQLEQVFERFHRIVDPDRGFVAGTGLGLPIVRGLVTRMGGTVHLESDGRSGTTAVLVLPTAESPVTVAAD